MNANHLTHQVDRWSYLRRFFLSLFNVLWSDLSSKSIFIFYLFEILTQEGKHPLNVSEMLKCVSSINIPKARIPHINCIPLDKSFNSVDRFALNKAATFTLWRVSIIIMQNPMKNGNINIAGFQLHVNINCPFFQNFRSGDWIFAKKVQQEHLILKYSLIANKIFLYHENGKITKLSCANFVAQ